MFSKQKHVHLNANVVFISLYLSCLEVLNQIPFDWTEQKENSLKKISNSVYRQQYFSTI